MNMLLSPLDALVDADREAIFRAEQKCVQLREFCSGLAPYWPEFSTTEMREAAKIVREYNAGRAPGEDMIIWPTDRAINLAYIYWMAGDYGNMPPLKFKHGPREEEGLCFEF